MTYLLDTQTWVSAVLADSRLGAKAKKFLRGLAQSERVGLAAVSLREASRHLTCGRIRVRRGAHSWQAWLRDAASVPSLEILPLTVEIAIAAESFSPEFPRDPTIRLIAATARVHDLVLLTADRRLRDSLEVRTAW